MATYVLCNLDLLKSMGLDWIHPRVLRELTEELTRPLSIIHQQFWPAGDVPHHWKLANVMPIYKKVQKKDPGSYRPISLTSVPGKIMEQILLSAIMCHIQDSQGFRLSQLGFGKSRFCLANPETPVCQCDHITM
ncbi:hypothetical protein TURU_024959 [Turdus rufiventris]|nr:hypothetical protein TURU_024959 [Turdus rufiventris]